MSRVRGAARRSLWVLVLAALLSSCVSLPTSGRVVDGGVVGSDAGRAALRVAATGPEPGAAPEEIVTGFLAAVAGLDDYSVAQEFLAPQAQLTWRPDERTLIHSGVATVQPVEEDSGVPGTRQLEILATVEARIDDSGERVQEPDPVEQRQLVTLTQVDGEWRISSVPQGVLVSAVDAERVLAPYAVYFPDPSGSYLVPDIRWFPQLPSSATPLVRALLGGPSAPLLAALDTSSVPTGTRLALNTVRVEDDGVAVVDLTEEVLEADGAALEMLRHQLDRTLRAVPGVVRVELRVDNAPLEQPAGQQGPNLPVDPVVDTSPYVLGLPEAVDPGPAQASDVAGAAASGDATVDAPSPTAGAPAVVAAPDRPVAVPGAVVLRLGRDGPEVVPGTDDLSARISTGLAVSPAGDTFAGLDAERTTLYLQQPDTAAVAALTGEDLTTPSFDPAPYGWVWTATAASAQDDRPRVLVVGNGVEEVEVGWLGAGDTVRALRVSRDGARVVLVVARADGSVGVEMAGVRRDAAGTPVALSGSTLPVAVGLSDAVDVAWVTADEVVVLGRTGEESSRPVLAQVGGTTTPLAPTPQAATVTSGFGPRNIVVGTRTGTILTRSGSQWVDAATQGVSPAFPG